MGDVALFSTASSSSSSSIVESFSSLSVADEEKDQGSNSPEKDPRRIARKYQLELCRKAMLENVIVYMETGCGKTHIAILLIYEMRHLIKKPQKNICVFLAPTVALVQQQAKVIEETVDLKVGTYCQSSKRLKTHEDWEKEIEQFEKNGKSMLQNGIAEMADGVCRSFTKRLLENVDFLLEKKQVAYK
ncbi:DEAD/DEAH box helicase domain [Dillenia turbinata]|uniref:DEAD/DEAH box helicase domain n=1 Tax=Dillenia turbinata TaxID=194707 RepID=A0AAN8VWK3_9MAGN